MDLLSKSLGSHHKVDEPHAESFFGRDERSLRKALDLDSFRKKMAGGDKQRSADFDNHFVTPASARAWKEAWGEKLGASPYDD